MKCLLLVPLFLLSCNTFKVTQSEYYKVSPGLPGQKSYNEIKIYISSKKKITIEKNVLVDNVNYIINSISSKGILYNTDTKLPIGNYIIKISLDNVKTIETINLIIDDKNVLLKPIKTENLKQK